MAQGFRSQFRASLLNYIREGMLVLDTSGKPIGLVTHIQCPENEDVDPITEYPKHELLNLPNDEQIVDELEAHLLHTGYVRIDGGLFVSDRFATPDQIALVTNDRIELNIRENDLIAL